MCNNLEVGTINNFGSLRFSKLGYENVENSNSKIIFTKYDSCYANTPKYKRPCKKIIFDLESRIVTFRSRNEKGNLASTPIDRDELCALYEILIVLRWY